jgi:DNA repair exonuclease SbcCD ATPase subunit
LFGKPLRQLKLAELVNRKNKKNCEVEIYFEINDNEYYIKRTLKPDTLLIKKNNVDLELRSSKKLIQDDIEKIIGVSYTIFKNAISLSLSNNIPFLVMTAAEKRKIIEEMFGIAVFAYISKLVKSDMTSLKLEIQTIKTNMDAHRAVIDTLQSQLDNFRKSIATFEQDKQKELTHLEDILKQLHIDIKEIEGEAKDLIEIYNNTQVKEVDNTIISKNNLKIGELTSEIKELKRKYEFYSKNDVCPTCNQPLEADKCGIDLSSIKEDAKVKIEEIEKLKSENTQVDAEFKNMQLELAQLQKIKNNVQLLNAKHTKLKSDITNTNVSIQRVMERTFAVDVSELDNKIQQSQHEYDAYVLKYSKSSIDYSDLQLISKIVSDDGVKKFFLEQVAPILSAKSNYYIDKFDLPVTIIFDSQFNCVLADAISGIEISYEAFSDGEKKRIDIAILLSIIETMKSVKNWDCNIIFFDELFDNAVDAENLNAIFNALSDIVKSNSELGIYLISHRPVDHLKYSRKIVLEKCEGFSEMNIFEGNIKEEFYG